MLDREILIKEAEILHRQFFRCPASPQLVEHYTLCHMEYSDYFLATKSELRTVQVVIDKKLDAMGIEPWLRSATGRHLLSRKLLLIAYLAESDANHLELRKELRNRVIGYTLLGWAGAKALFRSVRGRIQISSHELV